MVLENLFSEDEIRPISEEVDRIVEGRADYMPAHDVIYEPAYALNEDRTDYISVLPDDTAPTTLPNPMPIAITFFANQGDEPLLIKVGTAYESATGHRAPPPAFGALLE